MIEFKVSHNARRYKTVELNLEEIERSGLAVEQSRWCLWRAKDQAGRDKPAKIPCDAHGKPLSVAKPDAWLPLAEASKAYGAGGFDGIGLLMGSVGGLLGIDVDKCLNPDGSIVPDKEALVTDFLSLGGYVEVSPSGTGLRQFLNGFALEGFHENDGAGLEIYDESSSRYLTVTGLVWPIGTEARPIQANQPGIEAFITRWGKRKEDNQPPEFDADEIGGVQRSADEVLKLLKTYNKRGKITRLLAGDIRDYSGHSEADAALCFDAAYFCRSPETIDGVIRASGLIRPKWDERRGRETYGARTIRNALKAQTRNFDADQAEKLANGEALKKDREKIKAKGAENLHGGLEGLMTSKRQIRSDTWALTELLIRDRRLLGVCHFDEFSGFPIFNAPLAEVMADKSAPSEIGRITDDHLTAFLRWFGREWGMTLKMDQIRFAVLGLAQATRINPVRSRLEELAAAWDGEARLDDWLFQYMKATTKTDDGRDISEYVCAVGSRWVISVVARVYKPGVKADAMLILEGPQGAKKSSGARVLTEAVGPEYFREGFSLGAGKDDLVALRGRMVIEWGELSGLGKRDRNELKTFLTQQVDSYRQGYAIFEKDWPRTAVFIGTTNESSYLADPTGNRRFWPVTVGKIDLDGLRRDAGLLWGEAVHRFKSGERWWFEDSDPRDTRLLALAEREQAQRIGGTFWSEIAAYLADRLIRGQLAAIDKTGGVSEALPHAKFSVPQIRSWLATQSGSGGEIQITDANWPKVCDGLRLAGWDSKKSNGVMKWFLTQEKCEELCLLHGRNIGPNISPLKLALRTTAASTKPNDILGQERV